MREFVAKVVYHWQYHVKQSARIEHRGDGGTRIMNLASRELLERLALRVMRGEADRSPVPSLPDDKARYPKLLLLDFNHWVRLARAALGFTFDLGASSVLKAIRSSRASGRLVLAFTADTVGEAALGSDPDRRRRIAKFIVEESSNLGLVNAQTVFEEDVVAAAREFLHAAPRAGSQRPSLLHRGVHATMSGSSALPEIGPPRFQPILAAVMEQPEMSVEAIVKTMSDEMRAWTLTSETALNGRLEELRADWATLDPAVRRDNECRNAFALGDGATAYARALEKAGIDPNAFRVWLAEAGNPSRFEARVSHTRVMLDLLMWRDRNPQQPYRPNDTRDLRFLQLAIPQANIVVVEKAWGHIAQQCGVGAAYGTTILLRLEELPAALGAHGCL